MEDRLRIGALPAGLTHPIFAEMMRRAAVPVVAPVAMEVDQPEADADMGRAEPKVAYNHTHVEFPKIRRMMEFNKGGKPLLDDFKAAEKLAARSNTNVIADPVSRSGYNAKVRARNLEYTRITTDRAAGRSRSRGP